MQLTLARDYEGRRPLAVCLGNFDGLHRGHRSLMSQAVSLAREGLTPAVYTFDAHPVNVLAGALVQKLISPGMERMPLFEACGIEQVVLDHFTQQLAAMSPQQFFAGVLRDRLHAGAVICGTRYRFGAGGSGDAALLANLCAQAGIPCHVLPPIEQEGRIVSTSWVRQLLLEGLPEQAASLMGRPYTLIGEVLRGRQLGRTIGVPTVNQEFAPDKLMPKPGVYATLLDIDGVTHLGGTNVGLRPTVGGDTPNAETFIDRFHGELYGEVLSLRFMARLRDVQRFDSLQELSLQQGRDMERARELARLHGWPVGQRRSGQDAGFLADPPARDRGPSL